MNSATSTDAMTGRVKGDSGLRPWNFYVLIAMLAASVAVMLSKHTNPVALVLLSLAVFTAGLVGVASHRAVSAFLSRGVEDEPAEIRNVDILLRDKRRTLQNIKDLEFDHRTGKIGKEDFDRLVAPLRARAIALMGDLERADGGFRDQIERDVQARRAKLATPTHVFCPGCGTSNDGDAKFCKSCGKAL